jgi:hypothetical protein
MKYFLQDIGNERIKDRGRFYRITTKYVEVSENVENKLFIYNIIFRDKQSVAIAMCWDKQFESFPIKTEEDIRDVYDTYPAFAQLMHNTTVKQFLGGALVQSKDYDDHEMKYFVVSVAENLDIQSPEELFERQLSYAMNVAFVNSGELLMEFISGRKLNSTGILVRSFVKGMTFGLFSKTANISLQRDLLDLFISSTMQKQPIPPESVFPVNVLNLYVQKANNESRA